MSIKFEKSAQLREGWAPVGDRVAVRTQLAAQRPIFYGFARPDFALDASDMTERAYADLSRRFDCAVHEVERTREVVIGSMIVLAIFAFAAAKWRRSIL